MPPVELVPLEFQPVPPELDPASEPELPVEVFVPDEVDVVEVPAPSADSFAVGPCGTMPQFWKGISAMTDATIKPCLRLIRLLIPTIEVDECKRWRGRVRG